MNDTAQSIIGTYQISMSFFWFTKSPVAAQDDNACFCDFCVFECYNVREGLAPYWYRGFKLREGQKITFVQVKKCMEVALKRLEELHQPKTLQTLAVSVIQAHLEGSVDHLPLPKLLQKMIADEDNFEPDMNIANDVEFSSFLTKRLPGILWEHLGWTLVRRARHPWNRF